MQFKYFLLKFDFWDFFFFFFQLNKKDSLENKIIMFH